MGTGIVSGVPEEARHGTGRTSTNFTPRGQVTSVPTVLKKIGCVLDSNLWPCQRVW